MAPPVRYLAVEAELPEAPAQRDLRILFAEGRADAVWPLPAGGFRCSLELRAGDQEETRTKERGPWSPWPTDEGPLAELVRSRVPWLGAAKVGWAGMARFAPALARQFGHGSVWLAGDAAHVTTPLGVHSLNMGLRESMTLAAAVSSSLAGFERGLFAAYDASFRAEWRLLLGALPVAGSDPWLQAHGRRLVSSLPATGDALHHLLQRLGITAFAGGWPRDVVATAG
jgi:2-polyprenyl-6-methoxyphenol hydroxylase-like FAD-dependent oxidoreductase